jgi:hypothetical protein
MAGVVGSVRRESLKSSCARSSAERCPSDEDECEPKLSVDGGFLGLLQGNSHAYILWRPSATSSESFKKVSHAHLAASGQMREPRVRAGVEALSSSNDVVERA